MTSNASIRAICLNTADRWKCHFGGHGSGGIRRLYLQGGQLYQARVGRSTVRTGRTVPEFGKGDSPPFPHAYLPAYLPLPPC